MSEHIEKLERSLQILQQFATSQLGAGEAFTALIDGAVSLQMRIAHERKLEADSAERAAWFAAHGIATDTTG